MKITGKERKRKKISKMLKHEAIKERHYILIEAYLKDIITGYENELVKCPKCGNKFPRFFRHVCEGVKHEN